MATLEKIRGHAPLLVTIVGLALLGFIIEDFLNSGSTYFRQSKNQVVTVNGTSVDYQEYQKRIEEMTEVTKLQYGLQSLNEEQTLDLRQSVYNSIVSEIVMKDVADKIGIDVTSDELFDMIQGDNIPPIVQQNPLFLDPQTRRFNKARALGVLKALENIDAVPEEQREEMQQMRNFWLFWEKNMKLQRMQEKYMNLLTKAIVANPIDAKDAYEGSVVSSDIVYAVQSLASIPDSTVQVDESAIRKLYNERKEQFKQKDSRVIDYLAVEVRPSKEDYDAINKDMQEARAQLAATDSSSSVENVISKYSRTPYMDFYISENDMRDEDLKRFVQNAEVGTMEGPIFKDDSYRLYKLLGRKSAPDSAKISDIFLAAPSGSITADLTRLADSLMTLLKGGADFAELAKKYSSFGSAENGGDLGWLTEAALTQANLGKDFDREVFSAPINQPTLVKTNNGYHLLKVTERTAPVSKYKVAVVYMDVRPTNKTYSKIFNDLNAFVAKNKTADQIAAAAKENGYELTPDVTVTSEDHQLGMIQDARQVVRWAFENKSKGKVSDIKECKSRIPGTSDYKTTYVVAILRDVLKEGYQSFETVAPLIRRELAMRKKSEDVAAALKAKNLTSLQAYASAMNSRIDTVKFITMNTARINGIGLEPILNAYVAYAKPNTLSGPVAGYNGVYVFQVYNRTKDATPYNEKAQMREIEANTAPRVGYFALQKLVEDSKITDNRIRFE